MNIITRRTLLYYTNLYPHAAIPLWSWYNDFTKATFNNFNELKNVYGNAIIVANNRVVFNVKGNSYRLVVSFNFNKQACYIIWLGTHSAYDKIDVETVQHLKNPNKD